MTKRIVEKGIFIIIIAAVGSFIPIVGWSSGSLFLGILSTILTGVPVAMIYDIWTD